MNVEFCQSPVPMSHTLTGRFAAATGDAARAALNAFQATWRNHSPLAGQERRFELMADIDEHTLKDIGAPNWLIAQAVERKDAHHLHLLDLYRS
jgi:hypothetical protein